MSGALASASATAPRWRGRGRDVAAESARGTQGPQATVFDSKNAFTARLSAEFSLSAADCDLLTEMTADRRGLSREAQITSRFDRVGHLTLLLEGWAARSLLLPDGQRQITAILLPGDLCDPEALSRATADSDLVALTPVTVARLARPCVAEVFGRASNLGAALRWAVLAGEGRLRATIANLGQRDAVSRLAHLFCELHARMSDIGAVQDDSLALPLTQADLADVVGLTAVHVNRMLQQLRSEGLVALTRGRVTILDPKRLRRAAGFEPDYLRREPLDERHFHDLQHARSAARDP